MLLALTSAQRCETLQALSLDNMRLVNDESTFYFTQLVKTSRPGKYQAPLVLKAFTPKAPVSWWLKRGSQASCWNGHSTRAASSYAANWSNIHRGTILKAAGWSNATTFNKFYNKPLQQENNFGNDLLGSLLHD